jgi:hypothetical protein
MTRKTDLTRARVTVIASLAMCFSQFAQAEIWSTTTRITALYPSSTGYAFNTEYANTTYSTCDNGRRWEIPKSYATYDALVATLLLAFAQDRPIQLAIDEVPPSCSGRVNRFYVFP